MKIRSVSGILLLAIAVNVPTKAQIATINAGSSHSSLTMPCNNPNGFWGINEITMQLIQFELVNNVVNVTGFTIASCPGYSLAIADNMNGGTISPTVYTSNYDSVFYWDGNGGWAFADVCTIVNTLGNAGGNGNLIDFLNMGSSGSSIFQYDGQNFSLLADSLRFSSCADVAVDAVGNFILLGMDSTYPITDSVFIYDGSGFLIHQYPFVINASNIYGSFLLNGVYYLGLGNSNANPNCLQPVIFSGNMAIPGPLIPMPPNSPVSLDLASCNPGIILSTLPENQTEKISIYPTPTNSLVTISYFKLEGNSISIYDMDGKLVFQKDKVTDNSVTIDVSSFENGIYVIEVGNAEFVSRIKMCKQ